jgi:hypothetical protein
VTIGRNQLLRSGVVRRVSFGFFVLLALLTGLFVLAPSGAGAEGPVSRFVGFVISTPNSPLPTKIRAVGEGEAVCGTADVAATTDVLGFYELTVVSGAEKSGCPEEGESFTLMVLYGSVDDGQPYDSGFGFTYRAKVTQTQHVVVDPLVTSIGGWIGTPPPAGGYALMVWGGPDGARASQAITLLPAEVHVLYHFDAASKRFLSYVRGGPEFVQTYTVVGAGDIVVVKAR